jgi:hypothetical protein
MLSKDNQIFDLVIKLHPERIEGLPISQIVYHIDFQVESLLSFERLYSTLDRQGGMFNPCRFRILFITYAILQPFSNNGTIV